VPDDVREVPVRTLRGWVCVAALVPGLVLAAPLPARKNEKALGAGKNAADYVTGADINGFLDHTKGWVNVKSYGAKCDGVTNDSAAFQAALDAAEVTGGRVLVPGTGSSYCIVSGLLLPNYVTLEGEERMGSKLKAPPNVTVPYMIRSKNIDGTGGTVGYSHIKNLFFHGNVFTGTRFTEAVISFQAMYAGSSSEHVTVFNYSGTSSAVPGIWFGPGSGGDGLAEVRGEHVWVQKGGDSPEAVGILVSSDHKESLGGTGYEGIVTNVILYDVAVEGTVGQPGILVHSKSINRVRALDFRSIWFGGYTGSGLVLDGVTGSEFTMIYSDKGDAPAASIVKIVTPSTADPVAESNLVFRSIVGRNSTTPAIIDEIGNYTSPGTSLAEYRTDGGVVYADWPADRVPFVDHLYRNVTTDAALTFRNDLDRLDVAGNTLAAGGQVYVKDTTPTATEGRGGAVLLGGRFETGSDPTPFGYIQAVKANAGNGDANGALLLGNTGAAGQTEVRLDANGVSVTLARVPTYADNAAAVAGGLTAGRLYRTATGELRIVY
jgi:hypothetical protein